MNLRTPTLVSLVLMWIPVAAGREANDADHDVRFDQVAPILAQHCVRCHNEDDLAGDFSLQSRGGWAESEIIVAGDPESDILRVIQTIDGEPPSMPKDADPLTANEVESLRRWIVAGASWPEGRRIDAPPNADFDWWSFQPLKRPPIPNIDSPWAHTPIDAFILDEQRKRGLVTSPEADRQTLIRRLSYDLTGLPPTPEEIQNFVADTRDDAYERLVDRLLDSKHYGERWGRHWLDVVKYADTCGYDKDKLRPHAWPYRDYVIRSFNEDKPYSRFIQEQIAGDVLFPDTADGVIGLGFIAAGPWDFIGHVEVSESKIDGMVARNLDRDEMISNAMNTFCSVTIQCARCHDHKFDPFTQEHYYSLQAVFAAVDRADRVYETDPELDRQRKSLKRQLASLEQQREAMQTDLNRRGGKALAQLKDEVERLSKEPPQPDESPPSDELLKQARERLENMIGELETAAEREQRKDAEASIKNTRSNIESLPAGKLVYAAATAFKPSGNFKPTEGVPRPIHLLHRGDVQQPRERLAPGLLPLRGDESWRLGEELDESQRRAALANWLTDKDHPLVWRSIVNRIWQKHFGEGLVGTPNDFGRMGARPTHPQLLDWLACEFRDTGESIKQLNRLIVTSNVYRQSSLHRDANAKIDSGNQFLWRMNRRRLSAEEVRDSILAVSGCLDTTMGGPGFYLFELEKTTHSPHYEYHKFDPGDPKSHRRSVYRFIVRSQPDPYMTTLDCADSSQSTPQRLETLTALQALSLLNSKFNLEMSKRFAQRLRSERTELPSQIERAVWLVTGRPPTPNERTRLEDYTQTHGLENTCRMLLNLSEFVFLD